MLKSFFFVPANNAKFIAKSKGINADYIVFDIEDAVLGQEIELCFSNLSLLEIADNHFVRFRFFDAKNNLNDNDFNRLLGMGFHKFIIPKFSGLCQAEIIRDFIEKTGYSNNLTFCLLLEDPFGLLSVYETLQKNIIPVFAIGLGSHDYCNSIGMKHTQANLYFAKQMILNHAKAFNALALDTVSVNIGDDQEFIDESLTGFNMGFDGKFVIHPQQVRLLKEIRYYSEDEVAEAERVYDKVMEIKDQKAAVVKIGDKVFEKPHINRIINIINWEKNYGNK